MKKNLLSVIALILALVSLILSTVSFSFAMRTWEAYEAQVQWNDEIKSILTGRIDALTEELNALSSQSAETEVPELGASCSLYVDSWEERDSTLTLTSAYIQVYLPSDTSMEAAQLVLIHNGSEADRVTITLEPGEALGAYQVTLTDTWFLLPEMAEGDGLDLYLEVSLTSGEQLTASGISWYQTEDQLHSTVG